MSASRHVEHHNDRSRRSVLLTDTIRVNGLDDVLRDAFASFRKRLARRVSPAKRCWIWRSHSRLVATPPATWQRCTEPGLYGSLASDPTISRIIASLAEHVDEIEVAFWTATVTARSVVYELAGTASPYADGSAKAPVVIDLDATSITAHSGKENAAPRFKRGFGFHQLPAFIDHQQFGTREMAAVRLRSGNAGSNTVADRVAVTKAVFAQVPGTEPVRSGRGVLVRTDGASCSRDYLARLTKKRVSQSVGFTLPRTTPAFYRQILEAEWQAALDQSPKIRDRAGLAEFTGIMNLTSWPDGMRLIVRRERPHPDAQL